MNYNNIENKFLLLDSNIIINYSKFTPFYDPVFEQLTEHEVKLTVDPFVKFEVLRFAENEQERQDFEEEIFDNLLSGDDLPMPVADEELYTLATKIGNFYQATVSQSSDIEAIDVFLAARMLKFARSDRENSLFLATENHKDFPSELFTRIGIETIDRSDDQIHNIGFYEVDRPSISYF